MKPIASLTKNQENYIENTGEGNIEHVAQTYKCTMIPYAANSTRQDVCQFAAHQLLFFQALQQKQYDKTELRVNSSANFPTNSEISVQHYVACYVSCIFKAHFSIIILYYFMF